MHAAYLCPLKRGSQFCLNKLEVQRNCNATEADLLTSEDTNSLSNSYYALESQFSRVRIRSLARASAAHAATTKSGDDACTYYKHVGFSSCDVDRSRSKGTQKRNSINFNSSCSAGGSGGKGNRTHSSSSQRCSSVKQTVELGCHSHAICSMLVPLTCNQSNFTNMHHLVEKSPKITQETSHNTKTEQSKEQSNSAPPASDGNEAPDLGVSSVVPYWNIYKYEDFRELQNGNTQVFDPQTDANLHRESIIQDCYNRLRTSYPRFRAPQLYHVR